jgi:hypothetical protein
MIIFRIRIRIVILFSGIFTSKYGKKSSGESS